MNLQIPPEDIELLERLKKDWETLYESSLYRSLTMEPAKAVFANTTQQLIVDYVNFCEEFANRFYTEGPGAESQDLDHVCELMTVS